MKWCLLFSGQSIQEQGMGRELWRRPASRELLERLRSILGDDLEYLLNEAPSSELSRTINAQRAIHAHHLASWAAFRAEHPEVELDGTIGHSVGVVAALAAAGALTFEDSAAFIRVRAKSFADLLASLPEPHGLSAVRTEEMDAFLDELKAFPELRPALQNTPGSVVIGGPLSSLEKLARKADEEGWPLKIQPLNVEGPFHTPAFEPCRAALSAALEKTEIRPPKIPVFMGTSGRAEIDPERIRRLLADQASSTERHLDAVRAAHQAGRRNFLEVSFKPQPISWLKDQLPSGSITAWAVKLAELGPLSAGAG
jgi:[acyl-carrier-protein] S-malonyltransferase